MLQRNDGPYAPSGETSTPRVTIRAIVLAAALAIINDYWIVQLEVVRYSFATYAAPFYNCIFTLFVLTVINSAARRVFPRLALSRFELLTIYVVVSIASAVCSVNMAQPLVSSMGYAHFFQSPENRWAELFVHRLPTWLTVSDPESLRGFYYGDSTLYKASSYRPWIVPTACWSAFCAVLLTTTLCINAVLRKQWLENERLTFPIVILPLEMTRGSGELFRNRSLWLGFALAGGLTLLAGLHYLYPAVPHLRIVRRDIGQFIVNPPWSAMGGISVGFYFWAIGIAFLMPLELSFSCWFFYWFAKLQMVACQLMGVMDLTVPGDAGFDRGYPFINSQCYGAYAGFFALSAWSGRKFLGRVLRTAFLNSAEEDESREPIRYRTALIGAAAGFLIMAAFGLLIGMSAWVVVAFLTLYLVFAVIVSRIRAELGFPTHDMDMMFPQHLIMTAVGTERLPPGNLVGFSLFSWFNGSYASHPSPHQMESFKIAQSTRAAAHQMFVVVLVAGIFALPAAFWMLLHNYYRYGGATARMEMWALGFGRYTWTQLESWMTIPSGPNPVSLAFVAVGFGVSTFLGWMRMRFVWFPFHPLAYALCGSWGVSQLWMPILIGWVAKLTVLRFGGLQGYRRALPFFFGLILGEITIGSLWTILGIVFNTPTYDFWPGKYN